MSTLRAQRVHTRISLACVCAKVRQILDHYLESCSELDSIFGGSDSDVGDDISDMDRRQDAEDKHIGIAHSLYADYVERLSAFVVTMPEVTQLSFNGYDDFVAVPTEEIHDDAMSVPSARENFFVRGIQDLIVEGIPCALRSL